MDLASLFINDFKIFLKQILMGLAGNTIDTRTATLTALAKLLVFKEKISEENLIKIAKIAIIYLKEPSRQVHRVVFKLVRKILGILSDEKLEEIADTVIKAMMGMNGKTAALV